MINRNVNIARSLFLTLTIINFSLSSVVFGIKNRNNSCSVEKETECCCIALQTEDINECHPEWIPQTRHESHEQKELSSCHCNHIPETDFDYLLSHVKVDHVKNISIIYFTLPNYKTHSDSLTDYSNLEVRINPPPIFLTVSSFLI